MYKYMDDVEINITSIKNIKMIHFYHVVKDDEVIEAAMVYFGAGQTINLCVLDDHYELLIAKLFMVYEDECNKNEIIADEYTRQILKSAVLTNTDYYQDMLSKLSELDKPIYYHQSYMPHMVIPVVKHVLSAIYDITGKNLQWSINVSSWFGKGTLKAMCGSSKVSFPLIINNVSAGTYEVKIGNFFTLNNTLQLSIAYEADGIKIDATCESLGVKAEFRYVISEEGDKVLDKTFVVIADKPAYSHSKELGECSKWSEDVQFDDLIICKDEYTRYFELPWGQYLVTENVPEPDETAVSKHVKTGYVNILDKRNSAYYISYDEIVINEGLAKYRIFNYVADVFEERIFDKDVQIYFDSLGFNSRGLYKSKLADRYFEIKEKLI